MTQLPPIYFYIPASDWPQEMPSSANDYWQWQCSMQSTYNWSLYNWTLQTYLQLKANGFPCELVSKMPEQGIVVAHRYSLPDQTQPSAKVLLVCIQADKGRHTYAQLHIVQNPQDDIFNKSAAFWPRCCIPLWPQPGLIPRHAERGDRFENIVYLGRARELAPELQSPQWQEKLDTLGLKWQVVTEQERWNNYSNADAILAVRRFERSCSYSWKPPSKLINAWQGGVLAILGSESAYQAARQGELDYIEVTSLEQALGALQRLRDDVKLRQAMLENGRMRAEETKPQQLTARWRSYLTDVAVPVYERWRTTSSWNRQTFLLRRYLEVETSGLQHQMRVLRSQISSPIKRVLGRSK